MKYKLAAIIGIMFLIMSGALACHWSCSDGSNEGTTSEASADVVKLAGTSVTFTGSDSSATYKWWVRDDQGNTWTGYPKTQNSITVTMPSTCGVGLTVSYTATISHAGSTPGSSSLSCVKSGCIKVWVKCPTVTCPTTPDFCFGGTPTPGPSVTPPSPSPVPPYVYTWSYRTPTGSGAYTSDGTGTTPTIHWATLGSSSADTTYDIRMEVSYNGNVIQTCDDQFVVFKTPTGGYTIS